MSMATESTSELSTEAKVDHTQESLTSLPVEIKIHDPSILESRIFTSEPTEHASLALPPVDGGRQAWLFLAACFLLEGVVWGLPFSFGVFQVYYTSHEPFASQSTITIAAIGTTTTGIAYFSSPFLTIAMQRWPQSRRPSMVVGLIIMALALVGASFCNTVNNLLLTQGVFYAIGCILLYVPPNLFLDDWFVRRRGLAFGIMWAGSGSAGVAVPFVIEWLIDAYGFRTAMRVWAVAMVILTVPCLFFVKSRLPLTAINRLRPQDLRFVRTTPFWLFQIGNIGNSLGCFIPSLWMPSFARQLGFPTYAGPLSLAFYNGGYSAGAVALGLAADRFHVTIPISISTITGILAALIFWGLTNTQPMLYLFAIFWGIACGGFNSTWPGCASAIRRREPGDNIDTGVFLGFMAAGKGIGSVVSGPLSKKLLDVGWHTGDHFAYGTVYGVLVVFCGVSAAFGGTACIGRLLKMLSYLTRGKNKDNR